MPYFISLFTFSQPLCPYMWFSNTNKIFLFWFPKLKVTMITEKKEDKEYLGKLFFTLKYSFEKSALIVSINKCINLPSRDPEENSR